MKDFTELEKRNILEKKFLLMNTFFVVKVKKEKKKQK